MRCGSGEMWQQICTLTDDVRLLQHRIVGFNASQSMADAATTAAMDATTAAILATTNANTSSIAANAAAAKATAATAATAAAEKAIADAATAVNAANEAAAKATDAAEHAIATANVSTTEQQASKERLTIRQLYHALHEKLLRRVIFMSDMSAKEFWALDVSNISKIEKHTRLRKAWLRVQSDCSIKLSAKDLWDNIKDGKSEFDEFVHKGSFEVVGYDKLLEIAERVFVGDHEKLKPGFLKLAALSKSLSDKTSKNLFEY